MDVLTLRADSWVLVVLPRHRQRSPAVRGHGRHLHYNTYSWAGARPHRRVAQLFEGTGAGDLRRRQPGRMGRTKAASFTDRRTVVCGRTSTLRRSPTTKVVTMRPGSAPEWSTVRIKRRGARMGKDGDDEWDGSGIRLRVTPAGRNLGMGRLETAMGAEEKIFGMVP